MTFSISSTELTEQLAFWIGSDELALAVDRSLALAAGDPDVGHLRLARAVHDASHHRDLDRGRVLLGDRLDRPGQLDDLDLGAAARRASRDVEALFAQPQRLEDAPADRNLFDRVGGERNAQRVADALPEQDAEADRRT